MDRIARNSEQQLAKQIRARKKLDDRATAASNRNEAEETARDTRRKFIAKQHDETASRISNSPGNGQESAAQQDFANAKANSGNDPVTAKRLFEGVIRKYPTSPQAALAQAELEGVERRLKAGSGNRGATRH